MSDLARWVAGLTDAECAKVREQAHWNWNGDFSAAAFRAALLALVPKEETPSGPSPAAIEAAEMVTPQTVQEVIEWAQGIAALVRDTTGWTSDIAWAVRRCVEAYVRRHFDVTLVHLPYAIDGVRPIAPQAADGPWTVQACHDGMGDFWRVSAATRDECHIFECEAEALAVCDALNALPPSPGATP